MNKKTKKILLTLIGGLVVFGVIAAILGYPYIKTPGHLRKPQFEHYHFRTQIIVNGVPVDFGVDEFQKPYDKSSCSIELSESPVDFHDNVDQMTHIHWAKITGGEFLKYYGWNLIGGSDNVLGKRYDMGLLKPKDVPIYGKFLPELPEKINYFVYIGDKNSYEQKNWDEFLNQDLEQFFGKESSIKPAEQTSLIKQFLLPKAYAHGEVINEHETEAEEHISDEDLTRINNLIGNVVIFLQENEPSHEDIQGKFNNLTPLHRSTCGG